MAHPNYRHGRYDSTVPQGMRGAYENSLRDPELLNMRAEIALIDGRIQELLAQTESGVALKVFKDAKAANKALRTAIHNEDYGRVIEKSWELSQVLNEGITNFNAWEQVGAMVERRMKLVEAEQKRLVNMKNMITAEQALALIEQIKGVLKRTVHDPVTLSAITSELAALTS